MPHTLMNSQQPATLITYMDTIVNYGRSQVRQTLKAMADMSKVEMDSCTVRSQAATQAGGPSINCLSLVDVA